MSDACPPGNTACPYPGDCEFTEFLRARAAARHGGKTGPLSRQACLNRAQGIKLLLLDVDGVMTNGSITYTQTGDEIKAFHCRDGFGLRLLQKTGVEVGIITARQSEAVRRRACDLGITKVFQGARNKMEVVSALIAELKLDLSEVAYMGDDWLDLPVLERVGLAAVVADAMGEIIPLAHFVAKNPGGQGAVRELCDLIVEAKGRRQGLLAEYLARQ